MMLHTWILQVYRYKLEREPSLAWWPIVHTHHVNLNLMSTRDTSSMQAQLLPSMHMLAMTGQGALSNESIDALQNVQ